MNIICFIVTVDPDPWWEGGGFGMKGIHEITLWPKGKGPLEITEKRVLSCGHIRIFRDGLCFTIFINLFYLLFY